MVETTGSGPRLVPTELAAMAAGVTSATIRKWASRGKIRRFGTPRKALYDINDLMSLVGDRSENSSNEAAGDGFARETGSSRRR
jgi:hypothetical protein